MSIGSSSVAALKIDQHHTKFNVTMGQMAFIPRGWLHYIRYMDTAADLTILVVFDSASPDDIGLSQGFEALPNEILGATFGLMDPMLFEKLYQNAALIMPDGPILTTTTDKFVMSNVTMPDSDPETLDFDKNCQV